MKKVHWAFPLPRTHTGMLLGNGRTGVMLWGDGNTLRITLGRADWWDHRGGLPWTKKQSYAAITQCLNRKDERSLRALFERPAEKAGQPQRPTLLPVGRFEIEFPAGVSLLAGRLDLKRGMAMIDLRVDGKPKRIRCSLSMKESVLALEIPEELQPYTIRSIPAWHYVAAQLEKVGFAPPLAIDDGTLYGWTQATPEDAALCALCTQIDTGLTISCELGATPGEAQTAAESLLANTQTTAFASLSTAAAAWWKSYWADTPKLRIPNTTLQQLYDYGLYKFAGLTHPDGVAAGLQGPWLEEYQLPPWSSDYHFNINVQMCYSPAFAANRPDHLKPLWTLLATWKETLQHNAHVFLGIDDGVMLPHAVDDRCTCMGGFWTGSIDHGCTAWIAAMMYRYYRFTMDTAFLQETAWPFMKAAMRVYEEMLETDAKGNYTLPISVSPEYRGSAMNAWGSNASFQLACIHRLCEDLIEAAKALDLAPAPVWERILDKLPKVCTIGSKRNQRIALWKGVPLQESHRHHSHLAAIVPFDTLDWEGDAWRAIVERSWKEWLFRGPGLWSGWCLPWASMLHARVGNGEAAESMLELAERYFCNEGHGTLHNADAPGFSLMGRGPIDSNPPDREIMQMDLGMGAVNAILEMLLHEKRGVHYIFRGIPKHWKDVSFSRIRTAGAFLVSAKMKNGRPHKIKITATVDGCFTLANPWTGTARIAVNKKHIATTAARLLTIPLQKGQTATVQAE